MSFYFSILPQNLALNCLETRSTSVHLSPLLPPPSHSAKLTKSYLNSGDHKFRYPIADCPSRSVRAREKEREPNSPLSYSSPALTFLFAPGLSNRPEFFCTRMNVCPRRKGEKACQVLTLQHRSYDSFLAGGDLKRGEEGRGKRGVANFAARDGKK